ncbi:tRNA (N6-threonylcarbamoyladenosine(37)-N6)-methyltransferase TrmO [Phaeobacter sp. JH60H1]|uniref:tRNA (N6-threonylcarbamoyladenosine(37)-N6)-methyltransferase TrmO n=1 Tax=unclassified Phaeobacter TaxID=2621772 RepID=UPI003A8953D9
MNSKGSADLKVPQQLERALRKMEVTHPVFRFYDARTASYQKETVRRWPAQTCAFRSASPFPPQDRLRDAMTDVMQLLTVPSDTFQIRPIGVIRTGFAEVKECPMSGRRNPATSRIEVAPEYQAALHNIELASHLWVLYWLHKSDRSALVRQARGSQVARGIFASRAPNRPNPIGLSAVQLLDQSDGVLTISGLDCIDGTPVIDLKPVVPEEDARPDATIGW